MANKTYVEQWLAEKRKQEGAEGTAAQQESREKRQRQKEAQQFRQQTDAARQTVTQIQDRKAFTDQAIGVPMQKDFPRQTVTAPKIPNISTGMEQQKKFHDTALGKSMGLAGTEAEKTARQAAAAEKAYNDYLASDEYKADKAAAVDKAVSDATNEAEYYAAEQKQTPKEQELKAAMEYWQQQANTAQSNQVTQDNMTEFETWPEEDQNALKKAVLGDTLVLGSPVSVVMSHLTQNSLAEKYGKEKVEEMAESLRWHFNQQATEKAAEAGTEFAKTGVGKWLGQPISIANNLLGTVTSPLGYADEFLRGRTGQYPTMDPNNAGNLPNVFASAFRQQVASDIEGEEGSKVRKALSYGYQGIMGAADSLIRVVATGGTGWASLGLAAAGSFGQTISEASKQGATPGQAVLLATATAGLEAATEKLPLDELLKTAKGGVKPAVQILGTALKQAGIEATTEELSFLGSLAAEAAILREKSDYRQQIGELVANGMSYEEAKAEADRAVLEQAKQIGIVSGLSGAFSSFAGSAAAKATAPETGAQETAEEAKKPLDVFRLTRGLGPKTTTAEAPKNEALKRYLAAFEQVTGYDKNTAGIDSPPKELISMEDYANNESPVWRNVEYTDDATKTAIMQETHQKMMDSGKIVTVTGDVLDSVSQYYPDLRSMKKKERTPILKASLMALKKNLRQFLGKLGNQTFEFEVNDKVLEAKLYSTGIDEVLEKVTQDKADMLYTSEEIFRNAQYLYSTPDYDGDPNVYRWNYFYTPVQIGENTVGVRIAVRDVVQGQNHLPESQIYNWGIKKDAPLGGTQPVVSDSSRDASSGVSDNSIHKTGPVVNANNQSAPAANPAQTKKESGASAIVTDGQERPGANSTPNSSENSVTDGGGVVNENPGRLEQGANEGFGTNTVGAAESGIHRETKRSKVYDNTYANATDKDTRAVGAEAEKQDPHVAEYEYISEKESVRNARLRVGEKGIEGFEYSAEEVQAEYDDLVNKSAWTGEDNDTAMLVLKYLMKNGDVEKLRTLAKVQREQGTTGGQLIQSFAKYSRTPASAAAAAVNQLEGYSLGDVVSGYYRKKPGDTRKKRFENWKTDVMHSILEIGNEIEGVADGDVKTMQDIVRQLANFRRTTAWAGNSSRLTRAADRIVRKLDYETAKDIAVAQLTMIPDDFRKRSAGERVKAIRIQNMLSALTTVNRNLAGNATTGMMDALSDSTGGRMMDMLMSKFTGKRTVGNDVRYAKEYFTAAKDAADMAALCVELDIPMESEAAYSTGNTRNYSPNSGLITRFFSAYEKYLKYSLEVTDKFFEGGTAGAVSKGLQSLGEKSGLTQKEIDTLAKRTGERRTYKEGRRLAQANTKLKEALNRIGTDNIGAGDFLIPVAGVPGDVAQVGVDYSGSGLIEGLGEIIGIIRDAKEGKKIDAYRQRKAATDFGRGMTGAGLIALFTSMAACGIVGVHDEPDRDKNSLEQSLGLAGAQFNVDAAARALKGEDTQWKEGDLTVSIDFLEPFNSQMYIGYLMAQEDSVLDMVKAYPENAFRGIMQSVLDMPMMQTFSDTADIVSSLTEVTEDGDFSAVYDAVGQMAGNTMTGFIPSWMRQTAQYIDPYYRDTTGETSMETAVNQVKAAIPFLSRTLPAKYDGLGNAQLRYENRWEGFFDTFISPTDSGRIKGSEIADYLADISEQTGVMAIYPEYKAPKSFKLNGEDFKVSGQLRETYQKTYGENISALYGELLQSEDFALLNEEQQTQALRKAKEYATQFAKASVSDYSNVQEGNAHDIANGIILGEVRGEMAASFDALTESWREGGDGNEAVQELEKAYEVYSGMSQWAKREVLEDASGRMEYYLTARSKGISTETFTKLYKTFWDIDRKYGNDADTKAQQWSYELQKAQEAGTITKVQQAALKDSMVYMQMFPAETEKFDQMTEAGISGDTANQFMGLLDGVTGTGSYNAETKKNNVRDIDRLGEVAESNIGTVENREYVMRMYLDEKQEEKMDAVLDMGYDLEEYVDIYRAVLDNSKKDATIVALMKQGCSEKTAEALYYLFKPKKSS